MGQTYIVAWNPSISAQFLNKNRISRPDRAYEPLQVRLWLKGQHRRGTLHPRPLWHGTLGRNLVVTKVGQPALTFCEASPSNQNVPWSTMPIHHQARNLPVSNGVDVTITVTVTDRAAMDRQLEAAVALVQAEAMVKRRGGILVTRHGWNIFSVKVSETVPFGLTRENHDW